MEVISQEVSSYDRAKEVEDFDETKAGVKGLVTLVLSRFFIHPLENLQSLNASSTTTVYFQVPVIDLEGFEGSQRKEILDGILAASETWGFFQVVNHGVPLCIMDGMLEGVRRFHEQPKDVKIEWYSRDYKQPVREAESEYIKHRIKLRKTLSELLSEALGLHSDYLASIGCMETESLVCHYYPACPEPDLTLGATKHSDPSFLTILLQDNNRGLQVHHQSNWVDVPSLPGAFVINIGDFIQGQRSGWKLKPSSF
ncbi:hypothetical protein CRYUN_Cryun01aG0161800 [Craigia yunnanensis]